MTTSSGSPHFQIFGQEGSVMLALAPENKPVAILDDQVLDQLFAQSRSARVGIPKTADDAGAVLELLATLDGILKPYRKMRDEYYHRLDIELEREEAEQRLQDATNAIRNPRPPS